MKKWHDSKENRLASDFGDHFVSRVPKQYTLKRLTFPRVLIRLSIVWYGPMKKCFCPKATVKKSEKLNQAYAFNSNNFDVFFFAGTRAKNHSHPSPLKMSKMKWKKTTKQQQQLLAELISISFSRELTFGSMHSATNTIIHLISEIDVSCYTAC